LQSIQIFPVELFPGPGLGVKLKRNRIRDVINGILKGAGRVPFRVIALLLPVLLVFVHLVVMYATLRYDQFLIVAGLIIAYVLPPAGKETVIPLGLQSGSPGGILHLQLRWSTSRPAFSWP